MSFFPSPEPLTDLPNPSRYERMLHHAAGLGAEDDSPQSWSIDDAAAFWLPGWRPASGEHDTLPADGIMGLATRAFMSLCVDLPPLGLLCTALGTMPRFVRTPVAPYRGVSPHGVCYAAHLAFAPDGQTVRDRLQDTGFRALTETNRPRCDEPSCRESESMLGGCLPRSVFEGARRAGLLRSTRQIDVSPLTLLITRLSDWSIRLPYITVRQGADHVKCLYCPYWVHDALVNLARIVPALLTDPDRQALIRYTVAKGHAECIAELRKPPRLRVYRRDPNTGVYGQPYIDRRAAAVEYIWQISGAAACVWAQLQQPIEMWFGKKNLY